MAIFRDPPHNRPPFTLEGDQPIVDQDWFAYFLAISTALNRGVTTTVPLAKITGGGADGSLTIVNGLVTAVITPT